MLRIKIQGVKPKNARRLRSPFVSCPFAAWLQPLTGFQWLVPMKGEAGCKSQRWYCLFVTQSQREKYGWPDLQYIIWNRKFPLRDWGKKSDFPRIYRYAFLGWVRELPSTFIVAFTFDSSCSIEGLQSVTQYLWVSQVSQPDLAETHFMGSFSFTPCILHWC